MEALVRRVLKKDPLPAINKVVDLGNLVSIQNLVPIGAHAIDHLTADMDLRLATGDEIFEPFGTDLVEHPNPGEIIFAEGNTVLTRRWTWRQSKHTLILPETTAVEFNVDALPPITDEEVEQICGDIAALMEKYCGGRISCGILSRDNPVIKLT
jgi:DNA/RNA-binding domain of Phe-tRNA-synthetase-like protein